MMYSKWHFLSPGKAILNAIPGSMLLLLVFAFGAMAQKNQVANDTAADSVKVKMLVTDGAKLAQNQDKKGANYLLQAIRICDNRLTAFFLKQKVTAMTSIGAYYMFKGRYDSAKYYYTALAKHGTDYKDDFATARSNIGFANIANYQSDYETSVKRNLLALKYFESVRDSIGVATATSNIANSYIRLKQYAKAVDLLEKAIIIYTKKNNAISVANSTANLARAYSGLGNKQKELELKLKAFDMFKKEGYKKGMATVGINLGVYYGKENNITEALKYYNIALQNSWQINDSGNIALLYNNLADLYLKTGNTDKAMFCTDSAWYYAHKNGDRLAQADALLNKAILLHLQGKHTDAVNFTTRYVDLKDSIYTGKMETQVADMEVKYETEKKENQILLLNTANKNKSLQLKNSLLQLNKNQLLITDQKQALTIKELQLKNQNQALQNQRLDAEKKEENIHSLQKQARIQKLELSNQELKLKQRNYIIAAIMLLILGGVLFVYLEYKRNQLKQKAALQQQMMQQQDQLTQAVIEAEEKERRRIAGDLHDGVGQLFSAVKMNLSGLIHRVNIQKEEDRFLAEKTLALVDESCREVRVISHQMMPNMLLRSGIASDVKSFIEKIDSESLKVTVEASGFKDRLESNVETVLYRVIQETVNNVIKHAQASRLNIRLNKDAGGIYADVEDNGIGFDTALIDDFEGIGLKNIVTRIEYLKGTVKFQSAPDRGTVVKIWVPV